MFACLHCYSCYAALIVALFFNGCRLQNVLLPAISFSNTAECYENDIACFLPCCCPSNATRTTLHVFFAPCRCPSRYAALIAALVFKLACLATVTDCCCSCFQRLPIADCFLARDFSFPVFTAAISDCCSWFLFQCHQLIQVDARSFAASATVLLFSNTRCLLPLLCFFADRHRFDCCTMLLWILAC